MSFKVGDIVRIKPEHARNSEEARRRFKLVKILPVNVRAEEVGSGHPWRLAPSLLEAATLDVESQDETYAQIVATLEGPRFSLGQVVTVKVRPSSRQWTYPADQRFAVVAVRDRHVNIAKLGGEGGRYWRFPPAQLEVVEV